MLEKKEAMETQMSQVTEMKCKAVACKQCNYRDLRASERCRSEGHTLTYFDAVKRWFNCRVCSQKTITIDKLPSTPCS